MKGTEMEGHIRRSGVQRSGEEKRDSTRFRGFSHLTALRRLSSLPAGRQSARSYHLHVSFTCRAQVNQRQGLLPPALTSIGLYNACLLGIFLSHLSLPIACPIVFWAPDAVRGFVQVDNC